MVGIFHGKLLVITCHNQMVLGALGAWEAWTKKRSCWMSASAWAPNFESPRRWVLKVLNAPLAPTIKLFWCRYVSLLNRWWLCLNHCNTFKTSNRNDLDKVTKLSQLMFWSLWPCLNHSDDSLLKAQTKKLKGRERGVILDLLLDPERAKAAAASTLPPNWSRKICGAEWYGSSMIKSS